ncbi:MAG: ion transporter [Gammaproteobacteria bacterium]|nr:ion transporter [Gammaproteobacteria bacterium]
MISSIKNLTESRIFQNFIVVVILFNAAIIGMETYPGVRQQWGMVLHWSDALCLSIFVIEIILKLLACGSRPQDYFRNGWNLFDFIIVAAAFVPGLQSQTTILRLIRLLRVLRLLSAMPSLQIMVTALLHSIPRIAQMALLSSLLFYVYAVVGNTLFAEHDPKHWGTLHISLLSLFRTLTLEDWTDLMYTGMELYSWSWIYFVSFVLLATFVIFNMLIGIILGSMEEARAVVEAENKTEEERNIDNKLNAIREALDGIEDHLKKIENRK